MIGWTGDNGCFGFAMMIAVFILSGITRCMTWLLSSTVIAHRHIASCTHRWIVGTIFITTGISYKKRWKGSFPSLSRLLTGWISIGACGLWSLVAILRIVFAHSCRTWWCIGILRTGLMLRVLRVCRCSGVRRARWSRRTAVRVGCWISLIVIVSIPTSIPRENRSIFE